MKVFGFLDVWKNVEPIDVVGDGRGVAGADNVNEQLIDVNFFFGGVMEEGGAFGAEFAEEEVEAIAFGGHEKDVGEVFWRSGGLP